MEVIAVVERRPVPCTCFGRELSRTELELELILILIPAPYPKPVPAKEGGTGKVQLPLAKRSLDVSQKYKYH